MAGRRNEVREVLAYAIAFVVALVSMQWAHASLPPVLAWPLVILIGLGFGIFVQRIKMTYKGQR